MSDSEDDLPLGARASVAQNTASPTAAMARSSAAAPAAQPLPKEAVPKLLSTNTVRDATSLGPTTNPAGAQRTLLLLASKAHLARWLHSIN